MIRTLPVLRVDRAVTFLVGENGSGKSTLLEGIAVAAGLPAVGSEAVDKDETLTAQRFLGKSLKLTWDRRAFRGFFLRAEDFFGFTKALSRERAELLAQAGRDRRHSSRSGRTRRRASPRDRCGRRSPTWSGAMASTSTPTHTARASSSFFSRASCRAGSICSTSPRRRCRRRANSRLIAMISDMIAQDSQFIIATHSPILLGFPDALIYSFDRTPVEAVPFDELDHVVITRDFLNAPERFLRHL